MDLYVPQMQLESSLPKRTASPASLQEYIDFDKEDQFYIKEDKSEEDEKEIGKDVSADVTPSVTEEATTPFVMPLRIKLQDFGKYTKQVQTAEKERLLKLRNF